MGSLLKPTTVIEAAHAGDSGPSLVKGAYASFGLGGGYGPVKLAYAYNFSTHAYELRYSTPTGTLSGGGANAASGASTSGRAQVNATASPGGNNSGSLSYEWHGGVSLSYLNSTAQTLTGYHDFTGVANGTTSGALSDTGIYCIITDNVTGAQWSTDPITIGPLTWTNTIPAESALGVTASDCTGSATIGFGSGTVSPTATESGATGTGGSGSYNYSWSYVSGDTLSINNSSIANPSWTASFFVPSDGTSSRSAVWRLTVTDTEGHGPVTKDITVLLTGESLNGT